MTTITLPRATVEQALEALEMAKINGRAGLLPAEIEEIADAIAALRGALAQQAEPDHETRAELAEQQVVQLAEERDHYRNLWQKAQQAEPVEPVAWMHNILEDNIIRHRPADLKRSPQNWTPLCNCVQPRQSDPQIADRLARHGIPKP